MRKSAISAAAVFSSVALLVVGAPTASQALTQNELQVCWVNDTVDKVQDLEAVLDGPSFKTVSLDAGDCQSWDVRPGQYKFTVEDLEEFQAAYGPSVTNCEGSQLGELFVTIKRMNDTYRAYNDAAFTNGEVTLNVKKDRFTGITVHLKCYDPA